jgi:hypothetical protein
MFAITKLAYYNRDITNPKHNSKEMLNMTERKFASITKNTVSESGNAYELKYSIIVDEIKVVDSVIECYGIEVTLISGGDERSKQVRCITSRADEIEKIYNLLSGGTVFPDDVEYVLDDLLAIS